MTEIKLAYNESKSSKIAVTRGEIVANVLFPEEIWKLEEEITAYSKKGKLRNASGQVIPKILDDDKNLYQMVQTTRNGPPCKGLSNAQSLMPFSTQEWATMLHV